MKKALLLFVAVAMVVTAFAGCGSETILDKSADKLTYWGGNSASKYVTAYDKAVSIQKIEEAVGVDIEFLHPSSSRWEEQFNIMIASGEYADIMYQNNWSSAYKGGLSAAYKDGVILDLTPYYDGGKMPNFRKAIESNPEHIKDLKTLEGKIFTMGTIRNSEAMNASVGPQIRKDWLDKLNIPVPDTIGDWYNMLKAFKTQDPNGNGEADEIPFGAYSSQTFRNFATVYGVGTGFYADNGKIKFGPAQPEYKEFLAEMNKWYTEGLIDSEFAAINLATLNSKVTTHKVGSYIGYTGSNMSSYLIAMKDDPTFDLIGVKWPKKDANSTRYNARDITGLMSGVNGAVISSVCKDPDTAVRVLDYFYSDEATELLNWGVEGVTFTKENGEYNFTDYVYNNPDGKAPAEALGEYCWPGMGVPNKYWLNDAYAKIQYLFPQQYAATDEWVVGDTSLVDAGFKYTADENERKSQIQTDLDAYRDEMVTKMIIGQEPLSKFDEYVETMNKYGLQELIGICQTAYDRYNSLGN